MRVPSFGRYAGWLSGMGIFAAGMIVGAAVFLGMYQEHLSILHERVGALSNQNKSLKDNLENLDKYKRTQQYIGKVEVVVELNAKDVNDADINVLNEIKRRVYEDMKKVSGVPVSAVRQAPDHFYDHVDRKVYHGVFDKNYIVTVKRIMVIQTDYFLYITYSEHAPGPN